MTSKALRFNFTEMRTEITHDLIEASESTTVPTALSIPRADIFGKISAGWIPLLSISQLPVAADGESNSGKLVRSTDSRLGNSIVGGDITGTLTSATVVKLRGRLISPTAPSDGQAYTWSAPVSQWVPTTLTGSGGALDLDLVAIAALSDTDTGFLKKTGQNTWILDSGSYEPAFGDAPSYETDETAILARHHGDAAPTWQTLSQIIGYDPWNMEFGGDLGGTRLYSEVLKLRGLSLSTTLPTEGQVYAWNTDMQEWIPATVTDPSLGGDLGGTVGNATVGYLRGRLISATAPTDGQVYAWDNALNQWQPTALAGDPTVGGDLLGTASHAAVTHIHGRTVATTIPTEGQVYAWDATLSQWKPSTPASFTFGDDLAAIESLGGTSGLLRKIAANTWDLDTTTYAPSANIFNNDGHTHLYNMSFNTLPSTFAAHYVHSTGLDSPRISGATQYYGFTMGLGIEYPTYAGQIYWPRTTYGGSPYISVRFKEGGTWSAWSKIYAGYADSTPASGIVGTLADTQLSTNIAQKNQANTFTQTQAITGGLNLGTQTGAIAGQLKATSLLISGNVALHAGNYLTYTGLLSTATVVDYANPSVNTIGYVAGLNLFGVNNLGQFEGALYAQVASSTKSYELYGDYGTGQLAVRGRVGAAWTAWRGILDSSNYPNYIDVGELFQGTLDPSRLSSDVAIFNGDGSLSIQGELAIHTGNIANYTGSATPNFVGEADDFIYVGYPVYIRANGRVGLSYSSELPQAGYSGIALTYAEPGFPVTYALGDVTLDDWSDSAGVALLTPGSLYYLAEEGGITSIAPLTGYCVIVGRARTSTTLYAYQSLSILL